MRRAAILLALLAPNAAAADPVQTEAEARDECSGDPGGQAGMRDCLDAKAKASAAELKSAETTLRLQLAKVDEWPRFVALAKLRFAQANREFVRYRAVQCAFNTALAGAAPGNAAEIMRLACITELNQRRAAQLNAQIAMLSVRE